ncbi:MAG: hypothetical protein DELT_00300 [Desulfovibrio sp.]
MRKALSGMFFLFFLGASVCVFSGYAEAAQSKERDKVLRIDDHAISLGKAATAKDGFLEITLDLITPDKKNAPSCFAAILTVENSDTPLYIGNNDISRRFGKESSGEFTLRFATKSAPKALYLELGTWRKSKESKWYSFDMESGRGKLLEAGCPYEPVTVFDRKKLRNAAESIPSKIRKFKPKNPQPMHFIVYASPVINPVTRKVSTGGRTATDRYLPVSANDVVNDNGTLKKTGGLILTDDPNLATFVLILDYAYAAGGSFTYSDSSRVTQYKGINKFELYNLVSGKSIKKEITTFATYVGEKASVANSSKGKQLFAGTLGTRWVHYFFVEKGIPATEFPGYVDFVSK